MQGRFWTTDSSSSSQKHSYSSTENKENSSISTKNDPLSKDSVSLPKSSLKSAAFSPNKPPSSLIIEKSPISNGADVNFSYSSSPSSEDTSTIRSSIDRIHDK